MGMGAEQLAMLSRQSLDSEFYTPVPDGYEPGRAKFVVVTGSVMSGLGKGTFASSLGVLLQARGLKVTALKFDGYLNVDAGTLNPYRHGEVFVLEDGTECDMDLGNYERFLGSNFSADNYLTGGKIFSHVLSRERAGKYLGRDVQFIPHVTGEIKGFLRTLALKSGADVVLVEVGGTIGDIENSYFVEAMRQLAYEEGPSSTCFVNITYAAKPPSLNEQKTKPAQNGVRQLLSLGVQPHMVFVRCAEKLSTKALEKISLFSNVPLSRVIDLPDSETTYAVPSVLRASKADEAVLDVLAIDKAKYGGEPRLEAWSGFLNRLTHPKRELTIGITGKYTSIRDSYHSILNALEHAGAACDAKVNVRWVDTQRVEEGALPVQQALEGLNGIIVPGGFGARGTEGKMACIKYARERNVPFLGLCYGLQLAVIEYARNVCGLAGANSTEIDPKTPYPVITLLPEQYKIEGLGGNMRLGGRDIELKEGTQVAKLYGSKKARERFRHRYEVNPEYISKLESKGFVFSGKAPNQPIMQYAELPSNRFHVSSQAHLEYSSKPLQPSPAFVGFVRAML